MTIDLRNTEACKDPIIRAYPNIICKKQPLLQETTEYNIHSTFTPTEQTVHVAVIWGTTTIILYTFQISVSLVSILLCLAWVLKQSGAWGVLRNRYQNYRNNVQVRDLGAAPGVAMALDNLRQAAAAAEEEEEEEEAEEEVNVINVPVIAPPAAADQQPQQQIAAPIRNRPAPIEIQRRPLPLPAVQRPAVLARPEPPVRERSARIRARELQAQRLREQEERIAAVARENERQILLAEGSIGSRVGRMRRGNRN